MQSFIRPTQDRVQHVRCHGGKRVKRYAYAITSNSHDVRGGTLNFEKIPSIATDLIEMNAHNVPGRLPGFNLTEHAVIRIVDGEAWFQKAQPRRLQTQRRRPLVAIRWPNPEIIHV